MELIQVNKRETANVVVAVVVTKQTSFLSSSSFLFFFLPSNERLVFLRVRRNTMVSRRREVTAIGWEVGIIERGDGTEERPKEEGRAVGLISQGYIWNLMEAEFCRSPSVLCTQADFSRGLAYKSI